LCPVNAPETAPEARPLAPWIGGKKLLAERLARVISGLPHARYVEPFVGMGGVFFRRPARAAEEVINDRAGDVATLFRVVQRHPGALLGALEWQLNARVEFDRMLRADPAGLTDVERAARFLFLQIAAFGGKVRGQSFGARPNFDPRRTMRLVRAAHRRLGRVVIECLDWREVVRRYDGPGTLFYLDPPYHGAEGHYGPGLFDAGQFAIMVDVLAALRGRFILSINGTEEMCALFARFRVEEVTVPYGLSRAPEGGRKHYPELLVQGP